MHKPEQGSHSSWKIIEIQICFNKKQQESDFQLIHETDPVTQS